MSHKMNNMVLNDDLLYRHIGARLKQRRNELGMNQGQLAEVVGVLRTSITNIEAGRQKVPLHILYKICAVLEIEVRELLPPVRDIAPTEMTSFKTKRGTQPVPPKTANFLQELYDAVGLEGNDA